jgi:hypothetical protein
LFVIPAVVFDTIAGGLLTLGLHRSSGVYRSKMPPVRLIYFAVVFVTNVVWIFIHVVQKETLMSFPQFIA